uniref:Kinesin motor domain-containing protein n=1 Tax=Macrostomum lignano TaxID=282301 RepID=A0A1I8FEJ2_9PLAT
LSAILSQKLSHETLLQLRQRLLRAPATTRASLPGSADGGFNSNRQREQPRRNLAGSIWKLQKNAESIELRMILSHSQKRPSAVLQKHVDTLAASRASAPTRGPGTASAQHRLRAED